MTQKKLRFEDLQPHVDMLIDALENKGASSSGVPYNKEIYEYPERYRKVLQNIRNRQTNFEDLMYDLHLLNHLTLKAAGNNQIHRIEKIVAAIDLFMMKEYNRLSSLKES